MIFTVWKTTGERETERKSLTFADKSHFWANIRPASQSLFPSFHIPMLFVSWSWKREAIDPFLLAKEDWLQMIISQRISKQEAPQIYTVWKQ
jgi:hypothetical protein